MMFETSGRDGEENRSVDHGSPLERALDVLRGSSADRRAFTLVELLVVIAIIGILVALLLPAVQSAREAARRTGCTNNVKNIALAFSNYESSNKELPYGRKANYWDTYTWSQLILPYIEEQAVYDLYWNIGDSMEGVTPAGTVSPNSPIGDDPRLRQARETQIPVYYCPSDVTPVGNELGTAAYGAWRANYRGCVGSGGMYGNRSRAHIGPLYTQEIRDILRGDGNALIGAVGVKVEATNPPNNTDFPAGARIAPNRLATISDGTSNTLLISEGIVPTVAGWGGPLGMAIYGNMGGSLFTAVHTPNSQTPDYLSGRCPIDAVPPDGSYPRETCQALTNDPAPGSTGLVTATAYARSYHPGGVVSAYVDASVHFSNDDIEPEVWRALGTRALGDLAE